MPPTENGDENLPGACFSMAQGPNPQQTTLEGVLEIEDVLEEPMNDRPSVNSCTFDVSRKDGGDAITKGCFVRFQREFFNPLDKSI